MAAGIATAASLSAKSYLQKTLSARNTSLELGYISSVIAAILLLPLGIYTGMQMGAMPSIPVLAAAVFVGIVNTAGMHAFFRACRWKIFRSLPRSG